MELIKEYVARRKLELKDEIAKLGKLKMVVVQLGHIPASDRYVRNKIKDAEECGLQCQLMNYPETTTEEGLLFVIKALNADKSVNGYLVQLPLPKHINVSHIIDAIDPAKDIDGFTKLSPVNSCTPQGAVDYLDAQKFDFTDKNVVVLGRSAIVGEPLSRMLTAKNCNVTVLHSKTSDANKKLYLKQADLICTAVGKLHLIDSSYKLKKTATIIDFGMNFDENNKLKGDCDAGLDVTFQASGPGNTGLLTRLTVITNLIKLYKLQNNINKNDNF